MIYIISTILLIVVFCYWQNNYISISNYEYRSDNLPRSFDGYKILHISDLHNKEFGKNQEKLISYTKEIMPDAIFITGDLIDSRRTDLDELYIAISYLKEAIKISPIYYVSGNHEQRSHIYDDFKIALRDIGVINLDDCFTSINLNGESIGIIGLEDIYSMGEDYMKEESKNKFHNKLINLLGCSKYNFNILLSHRPDLIDIYSSTNINLVFSGHAHGGQIRIPFIGGLIAPSQGIIPKYTSGIHTINYTSMVISRGLGNSLMPIRIFNRPELVVLTLRK